MTSYALAAWRPRPASPVLGSSTVIPRHRSTHAKPLATCALVDELPDELVELVLDHLCGTDLARAECVSRRLRRLALRDDGRWRDALRRDFGDAFAPPQGVAVPRGALKAEYKRAVETLKAIVTGRYGECDSRTRVRVGTRIYA